MSKSKGNVVNPDEIVEKLGADTVRAYLAFIGPYNETGNYPWDPNGVVGSRRFIERVIALQDKISDKDSEPVLNLLHKTIKGVTEDFQALKLNTGISKLMILSNLLEKENFSKETYQNLIKMFAPVAPFVTEEIWQSIGDGNSIHVSKWPEFDEIKTVDKEIQIVIQVNGKFRQRFNIEAELADQEVKNKIKKSVEMKRWLSGKKVKRIIYIKNRLINFVLEE
jgi:leucyl-tRNA synthetase